MKTITRQRRFHCADGRGRHWLRVMQACALAIFAILAMDVGSAVAQQGARPEPAAPGQSPPQLELLYQGQPTLIEVVEYGSSLAEIMAGKRPPPPGGAVFDFHVKDRLEGRLKGDLRGLVTMTVMPDGTTRVEMHESPTTHDGEHVLFRGRGISTPLPDEPASALVRGTLTYFMASPKYACVNSVIGVVEGRGNLSAGTFKTRIYSHDPARF
jgi:hypothetical protein